MKLLTPVELTQAEGLDSLWASRPPRSTCNQGGVHPQLCDMYDSQGGVGSFPGCGGYHVSGRCTQKAIWRVQGWWEISEEDGHLLLEVDVLGGTPQCPGPVPHQPWDPQHGAAWWGKWNLILPGTARFSFCNSVYPCFCLSCLLGLSCVSSTLDPVTCKMQCSWVWYVFFSLLKIQSPPK